MRVLISTWPERREIVTAQDASASLGRIAVLTRGDEAMRWLRPQLSNLLLMKNLRLLLRSEKTNIAKMSNLQIAQSIATLLVNKKLFLVSFTELKMVPAVIVVERVAVIPEAVTVSAPREQPTITPEPERIDNTDYEAQAKTLIAAAEDGTPFCEACEKEKSGGQS